MDYNNQPPQYPTPRKNGLSVAALVCGILGIAGGHVPVVQYFTLVLAILGIVFGVKARRQSSEGRGMATAGLVCGIVGTVVSALGIIFLVGLAAWSIARGF